MSNVVKLCCSACGAEAKASCDCGAPYVPASVRAAKAIVENPGMSDRAIAAEIGVNQSTVSRERKKTTDADASVGKRVGLDGKARKPRKIAEPEEMPSEEEAEASWQKTLYDQACLFLDRMTDKTRARFLAHIRRKYHEEN